MARQKPTTLNPQLLRRSVEHRLGEYAFLKAIDTVQDLSKSWDALVTLHSTPNPGLTKQANAVKYAETHAKATASMKAKAVEALESLMSLQAQRTRAAEEKAGLHKPLSESAAQEIRSALRGLSQSERDRVVREAAKKGDANIVNAVRTTPAEFLTGPITVAMDEIVHSMVLSADPDLADLQADVDLLIDKISFASAEFQKAADSMRDPNLEAEAERHSKAVAAAEAALNS